MPDRDTDGDAKQLQQPSGSNAGAADGLRPRPAAPAARVRDELERALDTERRERRTGGGGGGGGGQPPLLFAAVSAGLTFVLVLSVFGFVFTGSATWGWYDRFTLGSARERLAREASARVFTAEELALHDGRDPNRPLLLAIKGEVFDVTAGWRHYGPDGAYHALAGKDASRGYASGCFANERLHDLRGLAEDKMAAIDGWLDFFVESARYTHVGRVSIAVDESLPPPSDTCDGGREPRAAEAEAEAGAGQP